MFNHTTQPTPDTRSDGRRASLRRHAPAVLAFALLGALATALMVVPPFALAGCDAPFTALTRARLPFTTTTGPTASNSSSTDTALKKSQAEVAGAEVQYEAAEAAQSAADDLETKASSAEGDASEAGFDTTDLDVDSAKGAVDFADSMLTSSKDSLSFAEEALESSKDSGFETTFDEELVADAKEEVKKAEAELATAKSKLKDAQSAAGKSQSAQAVKDKAAGALRKQADDANAKAQSLMTAATTRRDAATEALSRAQMSNDARESGDALALAAWKGSESARRREVDAQNRVLDDCRSEARPAAVAATLLGIGGLGLLAWDILGRRGRAGRKAE